MDKFLKEKLDLISQEEENPDITMPDTMSETIKAITAEFSLQTKNATPTKKKWLIPVLSSCIACIVLCVTLFCIHFLKPKETRFYESDEYDFKRIPYEQLISEYGILKYTDEYDIFSNGIMQTKDTQIPMYISLSFYLPDGELDLTIPINSNCNLGKEKLYELATEHASTEFFDYRYLISPDDKVAIATLDYNGYTYYFWYTSDYPEDITFIIEAFAAP